MDGIMSGNFVSTRVKTFVGIVNAEFAKHLLKSCEYPRQRALSDIHVGEIAAEMDKGWYVQGTPLRFAALPGGRLWLLNGQHSLSGVVKTGMPCEFVFVFHRCENEEEANHIYSVIDINKQRTWTDMFRAYALDKELGMNTVWTNAYAGACRLLQTNFDFRAKPRDYEMLRSRELQVRIFRDYANYGVMFSEAVGGWRGMNSPFRRSGVMAIGMETLKHERTRALEFWQGIYADDGLRRDDPRKALLNYLRDIEARSTQDRRLITSATAIAWGAWLSGEKIINLYPTTSSRIVISGTPWTTDKYNPFKKIFSKLKPSTIPAQYGEIETGVLFESSGAQVPITNFIGNWADS